MSSKPGYIPALDGLRALAVVAVVLYHMKAAFLPSGLLGVTMFFVLSGYLITGLLIKEWHRTKRIDLPHFWLRRVRRLVPAILFMLLGVIILTAFLAPDMLTKLRKDLVAALLFFTNWWYIFQDTSYFEAMGAPSPVTHFWSLAIEEQFYLIWPPLLLLLFKRRVKRKNIQRGLLVASAVSAVLMVLLCVPGGDPSRVYYGTDTRAFSLLIGAWLAFVFPQARVMGRTRNGLNDQQRRISTIAGLVALAGIVVMMALVDGYSPFLYYGGILIFSVLCAVLMVSLVNPRTPQARFFSLPPLVYVGKLSYSIYLWHYPLLLLMNPINSTTEVPWFMYVLEATVIFGVAAFSYHFVETPIRHGALGRIFTQLRASLADTRKTASVPSVNMAGGTGGPAPKRTALQRLAGGMKPHYLAYTACTCVITLAAVVCLIVVPPTNTQTNTGLTSALVGPSISPEDESKGADASQSEEPPAPPTADELLAATPGVTKSEKAHNTNFLLIGDSVTVALSDVNGYGYFAENFPYASLDSAISRQLSTAKDFYRQHVDDGWDGPVVIFQMGTNGPATEAEVDEMINAVPADKKVFLITTRTPSAWEQPNNELLWAAADRHENVRVIDWHGLSAGHDEYFDGDGTHLTGIVGCQAYVDMLVGALQTLYPDAPDVAPEPEPAPEEDSSSAAEEGNGEATA